MMGNFLHHWREDGHFTTQMMLGLNSIAIWQRQKWTMFHAMKQKNSNWVRNINVKETKKYRNYEKWKKPWPQDTGKAFLARVQILSSL
jgi:hypothetical protein